MYIYIYFFHKILTVSFSMILIAPCICKPSNVMKDDSVYEYNNQINII